MRAVIQVLVSLVFLGTTTWAETAWAEDWPQVRGPNGHGMTVADSYPQQWSAEDGIAWNASLPHGGNGSPIVCAGRVFVASAEDAEGHLGTPRSIRAKPAHPAVAV